MGRQKKNAPAPKPSDVELDMITMSVDERACAHLVIEYNRDHAALVLGWPVQDIDACLASPHVRLYLEQAHKAFLTEAAKAKIRMMRKANINTGTVESRMMELAMMDPAETKGNIDGQVKAVRSLAEMLGMFDKDNPLKNKNTKELEGIVAGAAKRLPLGDAVQ